MTQPRTVDLSACTIGAVLNTSSGSCPREAEAEIQQILSEAGLTAEKIWCGGSDRLNAALAEAGQHKVDVLIVLGGDGTIRAAAEACAESRTLLVPLPGGTMNMLPKALYGDVTWQHALRAVLHAPAVRDVHGGRIGNDRFFIAAILGSPSLWAEAREAVREGALGQAIQYGVEAFQKAFTVPIRYRFGNATPGEAEAVSVLCPLTSRALADDEPMLEAAAIKPHGTLEAFRLGLTALFDDWRHDEAVDCTKATRIDLESDQPVPAILDGETYTFERTVEIEFVPAAFRALVPRAA